MPVLSSVVRSGREDSGETLCILHLGGPKTGSSAIQHALVSARSSLMEERIYFWQGHYAFELQQRAGRPVFPKHSGHYFLVGQYMNHLPTFMEKRGLRIHELHEASRDAWSNLKRAVINIRPQTTLISSEIFLNMPHATHDAVRELETIFDKVMVVAYLRNPVHHYPSAVAQRLRGLADVEQLLPSQWLRKGIDAGLRLLDPSGGVLVKPYERSLFPNENVVEDFFELLAPVQWSDVGKPGDFLRTNRALPGAYFAWLLSESTAYSGEGRRDTAFSLERHFRMIRLVKGDLEIMDCPSLGLRGSALKNHVLMHHASNWNSVCKRYFSGLHEIDETKTESSAKPAVEWSSEKTAFFDWVMSYSDPAALRKLRKMWATTGLKNATGTKP